MVCYLLRILSYEIIHINWCYFLTPFRVMIKVIVVFVFYESLFKLSSTRSGDVTFNVV